MAFEEILEILRSMNERGKVYQLVRETPDINVEDQNILMKALENEVIPAEFPTYNTMVSRLSRLPIAKRISPINVEWDEVSTVPEVQGMYLRYILLPIAKGERSPLGELDIEIRGIRPEVLEEIVSLVKDVWSETNVLAELVLKDVEDPAGIEMIKIRDLIDFFVNQNYVEAYGREGRAKEVYSSLSVIDKKKVLKLALKSLGENV